MFSTFFLFQTPNLVPSTDLLSLFNSAGWQVGLLIVVVTTLGVVIRQSSANNTARTNATIAQQTRDDDFREAQEKATNELRARHDKLMDETRLQMLQERNQAQARLMEVMDGQQRLSAQIIDSQQTTIKMQNELNQSRRAEEAAVKKANELEQTVKKLTGDVTALQSQLVTANNRIDETINENAKLKLAVQRIKTGTTDKITPPSTETNPS